MQDIREKWDALYARRESETVLPALVLDQNQHLLPRQGIALDLACGLGANALLLARSGLQVEAWDISPVAIDFVSKATGNLPIKASVRDVVAEPPPSASVDVLVVSHFLDRALCPQLSAALKPGGILFYQTYCQNKVSQQGPSNPDYLLKDNELLALFDTLKVRVYREEALLGDHQMGWRNLAMLVAEKV